MNEVPHRDVLVVFVHIVKLSIMFLIVEMFWQRSKFLCRMRVELRERMFQKFSQADSSDRRSKGGTGLGLAITKELMARMEGDVDFINFLLTRSLGLGLGLALG